MSLTLIYIFLVLSTGLLCCLNADVAPTLDESGEHGISRTGSWGYDVGVARSEICDEAQTEVFAGFEGGSLNNGELTETVFARRM